MSSIQEFPTTSSLPSQSIPTVGISEQRSIQRVAAAVQVYDVRDGRPLGETRDVSLGGVFLKTPRTLRVGDVLPVRLEISLRKATIAVDAAVVHVNSEGAGLQLLDLTGHNARQMRRFLAHLTSVSGSRDAAIRLHERDHGAPEPVTDPWRLRSVLERTQEEKVWMQIIPDARQEMQMARLTRVLEDRLRLRCQGRSLLQPGDEVYAIYTLQYVSYSFRSRVLQIEDKDVIHLDAPARIVHSERRGTPRQPPEEETLLLLPSAAEPGRRKRWQVLDMSPGGLAFKTGLEQEGFQPDTPLRNAILLRGDEEIPLVDAVVRNVRRVNPLDGPPHLQVGVSHGYDRGTTQQRWLPIGEEKDSLTARLGDLMRGLTARATYLWSRVHPKRLSVNPDAQTRVVHLKTRSGLPLVGVLDQSFSDSPRPRTPLVIVLPGFGGRKEQMAYMAAILVETFRYHHGDVAVLRIDGSNNLGESYKDEGCQREGRHTLHFTQSGVVDDLLGCLDWARSTELLEVTDIAVFSVSFSSCAVAHFLAQPETSEVSLWVSYMGAPEARNAILHVSGHYDVFEAARQPGALGLVSLIGCLVDARHFWEDIQALRLGTLDDMRRRMALIGAKVLWLAGRHDAWMDLDRVRDVMSIQAPGERLLVEVESGHVPRTGQEAIQQFEFIAGEIWRHFRGSVIAPRSPSLGRLEAIRQAEWNRVRRGTFGDRGAFWHNYLLGAEGMAFDILNWSDDYRDFILLQADLADAAGKEVLDVGTGTGNLALALSQRQATVTCTDLVPDALACVMAKHEEAGLPSPDIHQIDQEGSPRTALARWARGDLRTITALAARVPGFPVELGRQLDRHPDPSLHAALRGRAVEVAPACQRAGLNASQAAIIADVQRVSRVALGRLDANSVRGTLAHLPDSVLDDRGHLPFHDARFERVTCSMLLSYLQHPDDLLSELHRVLTPGGVLVISSMRRDADTSTLFLSLVDRVEAVPAERFDSEAERQALLEAARSFLGQASELFRLEEEGIFHFYTEEELTRAVLAAGFERPQAFQGFGNPHQAVVIRCHKP